MKCNWLFVLFGQFWFGFGVVKVLFGWLYCVEDMNENNAIHLRILDETYDVSWSNIFFYGMLNAYIYFCTVLI